MRWLNDGDLGAIYGQPKAAALRKVANRVTPDYARFLTVARFCVLATVGPEGEDASPRGDEGPVVKILDDQHLALPDWRGNDRIDSLRNIVRDGRASLMFLIRGSATVIRVNGNARLTDDSTLRDSFARGDKVPRTVIVLRVDEIYFQCARAVMRAELWAGVDDTVSLPTPGEILAGMTEGSVGGPAYDAEWPERAARTMW